ncbi:MAG: E3 binding domain-containing protein, partial [Treponema sp.]|nr:E3 binding domain-containing protein [Treponema sp.]
MAERIIMPKQGLQMTEGTIIEWLVPEGGEVVEGKPLFSMETDKLTITIDAMVSGTLLKIVAGPGATVPITGLIAVVGKPGEDISAVLASAGQAEAGGVSAAAPSGAAVPPGAPASATETPVTAAGSGAAAGGRRLISPRAKLTAGERGVDWQGLRGSGPGGMIVERDILAAAPAGGAGAKATPLAAKTAALSGIDLAGVPGTGIRGKITRDDVDRIRQGRAAGRVGVSGGKKIVPMKGMRKIIAERMKQSQNENAQTTHRVSVRMDEAVRLRAAL